MTFFIVLPLIQVIVIFFGADLIGDLTTVGEVVVGVGDAITTGVGVGVGSGVALCVGVGSVCVNFTLILGELKVKPYAARYSQPSFSFTTVVATFCAPSCEVTVIDAEIGAEEKPYKQRAESLRIAKSYVPIAGVFPSGWKCKPAT